MVKGVKIAAKGQAKIPKQTRQKRQNMPTGIIFILILLFLILIGSIIYIFSGARSTFFGQTIEGSLGLVAELILVILVIFIILGIFTRRKWSRILGLIYFGFMAINSLASLLIVLFSSGYTFDWFFGGSVIFYFILNLIIFIYFYKKREFFNQ